MVFKTGAFRAGDRAKTTALTPLDTNFTVVFAKKLEMKTQSVVENK